MLAELLLSKTPAARVRPVYDSIAAVHGSPELLAAASPSELAAEIHPLGLHNKRAQQLVDIARALLDEQHGEVPSTLHQLIALPGVGPYIAHAVLCFAYDQSVPIVDASVARNLVRFFALDCRGRPNLDHRVWALAAKLVPKHSRAAKRYNYALLDFGAQVCRPRPICVDCPVAGECSYLHRNYTASAGSHPGES